MAKGIIEQEQGAQCAEMYRVTDPRVNAVLFLQDLKQEGLFDPERDSIQDFAWVYDRGELRFMVALDTGVYSAVACYQEDGTSFEDLQIQ